ncbi:hypothetical protein SMY46_001703 [Cronobacter turicensis]|uniref:hypothetical protein n=1 Tax=Cronobacter turicensis TaxID=413502 RepID=UPI0011AD51A8|nr:hypothetical protein [Cronobacter turicensis]EKY3120852.1 hypothetical protein [Cronobacter turicensis]ELU8456459.1 hypothetical protein [Cronobacter turicensis]ELY4110038.1 hypothetical protein [Cronobacter turicensis]ELY4216987.1 hypothetical protein [Cronobacter turicensis]EMA1793463.1 hypothetical protein [Cronobacter turicensis]
MTKLKILDITENKVSFSSSLGDALAIWYGERPRSNHCYDVEIDIDDFFEWGVNINYTSHEKSSIEVVDGIFKGVAKFLNYEDDGVLSVMLGDAVVLLEAGSPQGSGEFIAFFTSVDHVTLYPVHI